MGLDNMKELEEIKRDIVEMKKDLLRELDKVGLAEDAEERINCLKCYDDFAASAINMYTAFTKAGVEGF